MQIRSKFVVSLVSLLGAVACGDDDGGGSSVSSGKKVSDLSASEARAVCHSLEGNLNDISATNKHFVCVGTALAQAGGSASTCETLSKACEDRSSEDDEAVDCDSADIENDGVLSDCDATVGELTACISAGKKQLDGFKSKVTCSANLADLAPLQSQPTPEACEKIKTSCPGILGDD